MLSIIIYYSGIAFILSFFSQKGASILLYHSVGSSGVFQDNVVREDTFREHLAYLRKNYKVVPMADIVECLQSGRVLPPDWVAITFDDGYRDNWETALPLLKGAGMTATFFPTVDVVKNGHMFFYDAIHVIVQKSDKKTIDVTIKGPKRTFSLQNDRKREDTILRIVLGIRKERPETRCEFVESLKSTCGLKGRIEENLKDVYMTISHVQDLDKNGMDIGSHTLSHPNLTSLTEDELAEEIGDSKVWLETILGKPLKGFSFPFGKKTDFNEQVLLKIREAGYIYAVTTEYGKVSDKTDPYFLPRIGVRNASLCRLKVNLLGVPL